MFKRDKEMRLQDSLQSRAGRKEPEREGRSRNQGERGKAPSLQTAPSPSTLPHSPSAMAEEKGRKARKEAEAAVTLETEPGRWVRGD